MKIVTVAALGGLTAAVVALARGNGGAIPKRAAAAARPTEPQPARCPIPGTLRPAFRRASAQTALPLALLTAVAETESRFDPHAVSRAGAVGVMQVLPQTARELGLDPHDPVENVLAGARYLDHLLQTLGSADRAIAAYNAGPTAIATSPEAPSETVSYLANVNQIWRRLQGCA